uniref:Putative peptidase n=1 Tax=viral metagenome TaxID=1070528 RepID=A0A6M3KW73_9ZZZZ
MIDLNKRIPKPKKGEKKAEYVSRAVDFLISEGKTQDEAVAIANDMWAGSGNVRKTQYDFIKSVPMDISLNEINQAIEMAWRAVREAGKNPEKDYAPYGYVVDVYLDGSCIVAIEVNDGVTAGYKYFRIDYSFGKDNEVSLSNPEEVERTWAEVEKAKWSAAYINDLPDSCFAYIESVGKKDSDGKTTPRSLRHFPYKNKDGKVDLPHLRNALACAPQSSFGDKALPKLNTAARQAGVGSVGKSKIFKLDEDRHLIYGVVLEPELEDAQGDIISPEEIEKSAHDFALDYFDQQSVMGEMHKKIATDVFVVESYVAPEDFAISGDKVAKGSWVVVSKVMNNRMWKKIKKGEYTGYSIGGAGVRTPIKED